MTSVQALAYISENPDGADAGDYWAEGEAAIVQVERTDKNEIRVGVMVRGGDSDDATVFLTDGEAARLMMALGQEILS